VEFTVLIDRLTLAPTDSSPVNPPWPDGMEGRYLAMLTLVLVLIERR
jgi:hypothetical protein